MMSFFGELLAAPIRIINTPIKALTALVEDEVPEPNVLDKAARAVQRTIDGDDE